MTPPRIAKPRVPADLTHVGKSKVLKTWEPFYLYTLDALTAQNLFFLGSSAEGNTTAAVRRLPVEVPETI
jgi:hypothetical protein